jgi:putative ABC transport system substrate-binding protein
MAIYTYRPFVAAGGLIAYSSDEGEYYRLVGIYAGRILKGDKPSDLPVHQSIEVELIINLRRPIDDAKCRAWIVERGLDQHR